jgi:hypothetical protein
MFNSVALDVVIGLVVIYLLYSLLATVLSEMIASLLGLRARNLKEAISRMLNDHQAQGLIRRFLNSVRIMKSPDNPVINSFYNNPEIKYLGSSGLFRKPSSIKAESFSKALVDELSGNGSVTRDKINAVLKISAQNSENDQARVAQRGALERETAGYILSLWEEAEADITKFRRLLEDWFNRTMEQATEWYKRKIQLVLLVLGFCLAWVFCADTFVIVRNLSNDKKAREQMVSLADSYLKSGLPARDTALLEIRKKLDSDIANANTILGPGGWLPKSVRVTFDPRTKEKTYAPQLDPRSLSATHRKTSNGTITFTFGDRLGYLFRLAYHHFFGFLITAIAISLGAPFWFDLLNKVMKLRTSVKVKPEIREK